MGKKKGQKRGRASKTKEISGQKKKKIKVTQPKSFLDKAMFAIRKLRVPSGKGSSRQAIAKFLKTEWKVDNVSALRKALKKGVDTKKLIQKKQTFQIAGENPRGGSVPDLDKELCHVCWQAEYLEKPIETVRQLLEAGAQALGSALGSASGNGHTAIVKILLDAGADINAKDGWGQSIIYLACDGGHDETLKVLIDAGGDIEERSEQFHNRTPLICAFWHDECTRLLLQAGANKEARDDKGMTALEMARKENNSHVLKVYKEFE